VAEEIAERFPDGVWFVALAAVRDPALVPGAVATALGVREIAGRPIEDGVREYLRGRRALLVLDNFEHLLDAGPFVADLLGACRELTCLATSRAALCVSGEHGFLVPPLVLPDFARSTPVDLDRSEATRLFVARASATDPRFSPDEAGARAVAGICLRLDGLPLAIELAAARIDVLPPRALLARLDRSLAILTGGPRDAPLRLRSMRDAIAWSYDLLSLAEQALFRRLAVFVGGFTLEGAEAMVETADERCIDPFDGIATLLDNSLLRREAAPNEEPRFGMVETVREYGLERLAESGEEDAVRRAHAAHFLALAEATAPLIEATAAPALLDRVAAEHANLRAALRWASERGDSATLARLAVALHWFWFYQGHVGEGRAWLERAATLGDIPPGLRPTALVLAAWLAGKQGDLERASALAEEGLALATERGDVLTSAKARQILGIIAGAMGDDDRAAEHTAEGLALARRAGNPFWIAQGTELVAGCALNRGDLAEGEVACEDALAQYQALGHASNVARVMSYLAEIARDRGEYAQAAAMMRERLALTYDPWGVHWALQSLAVIAAAGGETTRAARLFGAAETYRDVLGITLSPAVRAAHAPGVAAARTALGEAAFVAQWEAGRALSLAEAIAEAQTVMMPPAPATGADPVAPGASHGLTPREQEVLHFLAEGRSDREIADVLSISRKTVGLHVWNILRKLGVPSRAAAVAYAHKHGLVKRADGTATP
jgi:non-specific serine/threonine protein kinase